MKAQTGFAYIEFCRVIAQSLRRLENQCWPPCLKKHNIEKGALALTFFQWYHWYQRFQKSFSGVVQAEMQKVVDMADIFVLSPPRRCQFLAHVRKQEQELCAVY